MKSKVMPKRRSPNKEHDNSLEGRIGLVYARVSSKKQESEGSGLQSQDGRCKNRLQQIGIPYHKAFLDSYTGGGDFMSRPSMRELLQYIDKTPHNRYVVVFDDLKRFAREVEFHFKLKTAFKLRNVILVCLNYNFDESPEGQFAELIMAGQAELERHQNRRQVIQKQKSRLENGYWAFVAKKGYVIKSTVNGKLSVPHKIDGKLLTRALNGFATGEFVRKIDACKFLVEQGFWKRATPEKYVQKFTEILADPFYCGDIHYPKWEISRRSGHHKSLITKGVFDLIQSRLNSNDITQRIRKDVSSDFIMRGLIVCADCDNHLTASWSKGRKGKQYGYYFCSNIQCTSYRSSCPKFEVEDRFADILKDNLTDIDFGEIQHIFRCEWSNEIALLSKKNHANVQKIALLEEKIARLTTMVIETNSEHLRFVYEKQIEEMAIEMNSFSEKTIDEDDLKEIYRTALKKVLKLLKNPYKIWISADTLEKHKLYFFLFERKLKYCKNKGYRTAKSPYCTSGFEDKSVVLSNYVHLRLKTYNQLKEFLQKFWEYYNLSPILKELLSKGSFN